MNTPVTHFRAGAICVGVALIFSIYSGRLIHLQVGKHAEFSELAAEKTAKKKVIPADRGIIRDVRGEVLADNVPIYAVVVDGKLLSETKADREKVTEILARHLQMPAEQVAERIAGDRAYIVVQRHVPALEATAIRDEMSAARIRGVMFERETKRLYPNNEMLGHVVGFLDHNGGGIQGVEKMMDPYLRGEDGFIYTERDRRGREIVAYRGLEREARHGMDVQLTIDMGLQEIVERQLDEAYQRINPNMITAVFVRPRTGEILAMATRPAFNPNEHNNAPVETTKNRAVIEMFEPGSTFKTVVIAAALNEGVITPETPFNCENGNFFYAGRNLRDSSKHGVLTAHNVLVKSSNIGCAKIAMQIGADTYYEYIRRFGFGERTALGLPGEIPGMVRPRHRWTPLSITRVPMGHEIAVTPIQIAMSMAVIANDGVMMQPQIVHSVRDNDGREVVSFRPQMVRRVIKPETAQMVAAALVDVVGPTGTARLASVPGYKIAGKTGTAQRVDPKGGYTPGKYVVSFAGYFPASDPEIAGIVLVDDASTPGTSNYGGTVAAPIFGRIAEDMVRYLDLPPDADGAEGTTVALVPFNPTAN